jgi:hypothetical protein
MPTHRERYNATFFSENGTSHIVRIYDKNYSGQSIPIKVGGGGVNIKYDSTGQEKFSPIIASKCSISLVVEDNVFGVHLENFIKNLRTTYEEGDVTIVIWNTGSTADTPIWSGNVLIDLSAKEDVSKPYEIELSATDGLGLLKNYDMVKTQGTNPYDSAHTYIGDGYQTFIYWIKEILEFCNTPDGDSTDGDVSDYTFSTSVDWWYENHPAADPSVSPLAYTQAQMLGCYRITQDGTYTVKNVYEVLESICKMWGMRVVFWKNTFYFTQIELYNTPDAGNYATPDNVDSQIWRRNGTFGSSQEYLGDTFYALYSQEIETNAGGFNGGLQTLAGSKWDYYPKLKEVQTDFANVGNNNYYQIFPQPNNDEAANAGDRFSSSSLGTINNAASLGGFHVNINLYFTQPSNSMMSAFNLPWSIRAKPSADSDFANGYYLPNMTTSPTAWVAWPGIGATAFSTLTTTPVALTNGNNWIYILDLFQNFYHSGSTWTNIYNSATFNLLNGVIPTDSNFTGSWDFEIFTYMTYLNETGGVGTGGEYVGPMVSLWGGGTSNIDYRDNIASPSNPISYSDVLDANGNPTSQFNCVYSNTVGGTNIVQSTYSARSETQKQSVKNIFWGDAPVLGDANALIWADDSGNSGYTDPAGLWRNGQSGSYDKTITELLSEARLFNQQQSDYKWSLGTAVSSINSSKNDGSGSRPVYINPIGKIHDSVENIFYYMLRGTFNMNSDTWNAEWLQVSLNAISVTSTTTGTGGSDQDDNNIAAMLAPPSTTEQAVELELTRLSGDLAAGTITSLPIVALSRGTATDLSETNIIKSGDKILLRRGPFFHEFEASADVADSDTSISVTSTTTYISFPSGSLISFNPRDLYKQYQHQDRGTVGGMKVATSELGPITIDGEGNYTIDAEVINGVDLDYIKLIPRDFISNDDQANKEWAFDDTGTTGVRIFNANTELWAFVPIPYGKKATHVAVWGNNTKDVEAYELDINASGIGTALGSGTVGTEFSITNLSSDSTNYLGVKVITTGTSNRIYGGKITLANI